MGDDIVVSGDALIEAMTDFKWTGLTAEERKEMDDEIACRMANASAILAEVLAGRESFKRWDENKDIQSLCMQYCAKSFLKASMEYLKEKGIIGGKDEETDTKAD